MNEYDIIIQPWLTEKSMEARTSEQRLEFIVRRSAAVFSWGRDSELRMRRTSVCTCISAGDTIKPQRMQTHKKDAAVSQCIGALLEPPGR